MLATNLDTAHGVTGKDANQRTTGSATATLNLIRWLEDDSFYETGDTVTITNRDEHFSAGAGAHLVAFKIEGEFRPLPTFQTLRGRLRRTLSNTDDVVNWPTWGLMEVLGQGRVLGLISATDSSDAAVITTTTATTFVVTGNVTSFATSGRYLVVENAGAVDGRYTISSSSFSGGSTTITVSEAVGTPTLTASSTARVAGNLVVVGPYNSTVTDYVSVGDVLTIFEQTEQFTVLVKAYSAPNLTLTVDEDVNSADLVDELTPTVITATTATTITITGDVRPDCITGHYLIVENAGSANGTYTIFSVVEDLVSGNTRVVVNEAVGTPTLTGSSTATIVRSVMQRTIHPDSRLTYAIQSVVAGNPGDITINDPALTLTDPDDPITADEMFLEGMRVEITGSNNAENDGVYRCRKSYVDNGSTITIYLDGVLATPTGAKGSVTLKVPPPLCVISKADAVLRWYQSTLYAHSIVHTLPPDGDEWCEIIGSDIGPSQPADPDVP